MKIMEISSLFDVDLSAAFQAPKISSPLVSESDSLLVEDKVEKSAFSNVFDSAVNLVKQTNDYSNAAEEEEIKFALGETDSIHDVQIAQQKANVALQYTVAVRDAFLQGYREIMNLQF